MEQRANFLALTLLDALEDENESDIFAMLERNLIDAAVVPCERGIAPLHYVCGMQNEELALRVLTRFLENSKLDVNMRCDGNMTALHIAAMYGRLEQVRLLLQHGARVDLADDEHKLPVHYAIEECHFEVLQLMRDHIFLEKCARDRRLRVEEQKSSTPKSTIKYNYDVTSPYYINITHRRGKPQPKFPDVEPILEPEIEQRSLNLFSLTREHLAELTQSQTEPVNRSRRTLIDTWREKVERSRVRQSQLQTEHIEAMVDEALEEQNFSYQEHLRKSRNDSPVELPSAAVAKDVHLAVPASSPSARAAFGHLVEQVAQAQVLEEPQDSSFQTAQAESEVDTGRTGLIRSPRQDEYFLQMTEAYVHTDDENGLVFYETKLLQNGGNKAAAAAALKEQQPLNSTTSSHSTNLTLPLDYETDELRAELTQFGAPVGPITKTTKRLYIKQLIKYKRNTEQKLASQQHAKSAQIKYSVELHRTLRSQQDFARIVDYMPHETASAAHFAAGNQVRCMREGHLKQSFIYMLIDPGISRNLPGESAFMDKFNVWQRFLDSIFYVGKGKSTRPYAHLYDAMRQHTKAHLQRQQKCTGKRAISIRKHPALMQPDLFKSPPAANEKPGSKKLQRILDIWRQGRGVVCLHVFHNITPSDAYAREAAIIDALSLSHLTNLKRGDYYGPAQSWTMKQKKQLGIALLYKAMHIYLAEGESQLSPSDLI